MLISRVRSPTAAARKREIVDAGKRMNTKKKTIQTEIDQASFFFFFFFNSMEAKFATR